MIRYHTLGTLRLRTDDESDVNAVLAQPMQIALLTYLAVARPRGFHRRDALLGLFWPDLDTAHARGALNQAVYRLRGSLGNETVVSRGKEELGIDPSLLWCDVVAFETAFENDSYREALEHYGGDLLAGFFLSATPTWERWLEAERGRLQQMTAGAAWRVADEAAADGRVEDTGYWGRRALALDPGNEASLRRLITLLDGVGDRAGAVRAYEEAAELFAVEYETRPSPETRALIEHVRARIEPRERAPDASTASSPPTSRPVASPGAAGSAQPSRSEAVPRSPATARRRRTLWAVPVAVGGLIVVAALWQRPEARAPGAGDTVSMAAEDAVRASSPTSGSATTQPWVRLDYDRGRYYLSQIGPEHAFQARDHFQRALDLDPTFAAAWSGLSAAFVNLAKLALLPAREAFPPARAAAEEALHLNPRLAEAHALLGWTLASYFWDTQAADHHFGEAVALDPNDARTRRFYAAHLRNLGRFEEALAEIRLARELDPLFAFSHIEEGLIHYMARDFEKAIEHFEMRLRVAPEQRHTHTFIALAETARGRFEAALQALDRTDPDVTTAVAVALRGYIFGRTGRIEEARRMLRALDGLSPDRAVVPMQRALIHVGLGEFDEALDLLEEGLEEPTHQIRLLNVEPLFEPLHADPRFQDLLRNVGFSP